VQPAEWTFRNLTAPPSEHALGVLAELLIDLTEGACMSITDTDGHVLATAGPEALNEIGSTGFKNHTESWRRSPAAT
jgi:hypothetical protein